MKRVLVLGLVVFAMAAGGNSWGIAVDPISPGSWTMILLPDTQHYTESYPSIFQAQTQWIANNKTSLNIQMVLQQGDITNNGSTTQFATAKTAMSTLNTAGVRYSIAPGNHDYTLSTRFSNFNNSTYFGPGSAYAAQSHFQAQGSEGSRFFESGKTDNSYCTFTAGGQDWLIFSTEYGPRDEVVAWMDSVATAHPDHNLILNTHAYMYSDNMRYDWATYGTNQTWNPHSYTISGTANDGKELWDKLISKHDNWRFTFNGHVLNDGTARMSSVGDNGNVVHQLLANYQNRDSGGNGYLRILEFLDDGNTVNISTYSPTLGAYLDGPTQIFTLQMDSLTPSPNPVIRGVSSANVSVPASATTNATSIWAIDGSGPKNYSFTSPPNVADVSLAIDGVSANRDQGVLMATVRQNSRNGYYGTVEVAHVNVFDVDLNLDDINLQIATSRAYNAGEYNMNVATGFFPFADGWIGGHVLSDATLLEHYGVDASNVTTTSYGGLYKVTIDNIDSRTDGMLFAVGAANGYNYVSTAPLGTGSGWYVAVRDNTAASFSELEINRWSFVYLDYDAPGLIGGNIAADGTVVKEVGDFSLNRVSTGVYRITVDGYTPDDGALLLTIAEFETDGVTRPDDNIITYEDDGSGGFLVNVRDRNGSATTLEDGAFVFAFLPFDGQLAPAIAGDANYDGHVDSADAALLAANWGEADAVWAMGDFNLDGVVNAMDASILAACWGNSVSEGNNAVPEPSALMLIAIAGLCLTTHRRRHG